MGRVVMSDGDTVGGVGGPSVSNGPGESGCCQHPWPSSLGWLLLPQHMLGEEAVMVVLMGAGAWNNKSNQSY